MGQERADQLLEVPAGGLLHPGFAGPAGPEGRLLCVAPALAEHGHLIVEQMDRLGDLDEAITAIGERYRGAYACIEHWAEELVCEIYELPEVAVRYFDYGAFARDAELGGDIIVVELDGQDHVFDGA